MVADNNENLQELDSDGDGIVTLEDMVRFFKVCDFCERRDECDFVSLLNVSCCVIRKRFSHSKSSRRLKKPQAVYIRTNYRFDI